MCLRGSRWFSLKDWLFLQFPGGPLMIDSRFETPIVDYSLVGRLEETEDRHCVRRMNGFLKEQQGNEAVSSETWSAID